MKSSPSKALCCTQFALKPSLLSIQPNQGGLQGMSMSSTAVENPLLEQKSLPLFEKITADHITPAVTDLVGKVDAELGQLEKKLKNPDSSENWTQDRNLYSFEAVLDELEKIRSPLEFAWGVIGHLNGVKNSEELRDAYQKMQPQVIQVMTKLGQSKTIYKAMKQLQMKSHAKDLDEAQMRIIDAGVRSMQLTGVGLEGTEKERFNAILMESAELSTKFTNNVLDATKAFSLLLTKQSEIEGLPDSARALAAQTAVGKGHEGATPEAGPWVITLDMPSYLPVMQHLKSRDIREKLYKAFITRASEGELDNAPLIKKILTLKKEMANILGYDTYAELSLASKMAPSVQAVDDLSEFLREKSFPAAQKELADLQAYATSKGFDEELALWDVPFWSERQKEELYSFSEEELRPYFPLPNVLQGMFQLASRIFGVEIVEAAKEDSEVWHPDVSFWHINDGETGDRIASFYLDPYSRPAEKRGGAWMDVCIGKSKVLDRLPVAYLTCNGSPPIGETPSLMTFREVETLFHEFGHGLQHMLTKIEYADAAGINNVEWDAVELPSQFMENWCYDEPTVYQFAKHYETGEPLPKELFEKLKAQRTYQAGMMMCRQLLFGQLDMELHHRYDPETSDLSVFDVQAQLAPKYSVIPPLPTDRFLCSFSHIFGGGYAAGYYSYKWAEVMSADAFGAFEDVGLENEEAVKEVGLKFRNTVLAMGGGKDPMQVFKDFRGREPTPDALLRHSGL
eukprot:CAMPEP_0117755460 /NCGR_PEP_ID=MMETSP0947-20121206/13468_1 /TAXON_ID=44440 /ORGANISM="Chattonella subsalsa, Strain CCMP2191" /LENGTH=738 /DNA_ID=CAMNT_0005574805 /DNA_START=153 /DNA_END=2369 /DNA_ORIENTATION=+